MPGWQWVPTPGHSPGHISLFREADRALIAGDAFVTQKQESALGVLTRHQEVRRPPAYYTSDWQTARRSVAALAALEPNIAATGHGIPMSGERMRRQLHALVRDWDRVAIPPHGRYIHRPALTNERGLVAVPPPVTDPQLPWWRRASRASSGPPSSITGSRDGEIDGARVTHFITLTRGKATWKVRRNCSGTRPTNC